MQPMADDGGRVLAAERSLATAVGERDRQVAVLRSENDVNAARLRHELNEMQSVAEQQPVMQLNSTSPNRVLHFATH